MQRILTTLLVISIVVIALAVAAPAVASDEHLLHHCQDRNGDDRINGADFGLHVAQHAQEGLLGGEHNPGHHQGYSSCVVP